MNKLNAAGEQRKTNFFNEDLFHLIVDSLRDYAIFAIDLDGSIASWNVGAERLFGFSEKEILGRALATVFTPEDVSDRIPEQELETARKNGQAEDKRWHLRRDNSRFWANGIVTALKDENGNLNGFVKIAQDQTEIKLALEERENLLATLESERNRLLALLHQMPIGIIVAEAPSGKIIHYNERSELILGHPLIRAEGVSDYSDYGAVHADQRRYNADEYPIVRAINNETIANEQLIYIRGNGQQIYLSANAAPIYDVGGKITHAILTFYDITRRKAEEEQIAYAAFHDALTRLPNRRLLTHHLKRAIDLAKRHDDYLFAVLFLDLDRFKIINDSLGHAAGDKLLINAAYKLKVLLRTEDIIARLGGDEFVILLTGVRGIADAIHVAERIHQELKEPFQIDEHEIFTSASVGIALSDSNYTDSEEILRDADTAMYRAKFSRAPFEIFDPSMHRQMMELLRLENDLRRAVERREFLLYYQPIVALANNRIVGFEALLRWQHPERGLIAPAEFIAIAEETGLIIPIGNWVLKEAAGQICKWQQQFQADPLLTISVNVSSLSFAQPDFVKQVCAALEETGLRATSLKLEITESSLMKCAQTDMFVLEQLTALGVKLHIDDFGTGYSSLNYLHRLPIDVLKIDRSFVQRLGVPDEDYAVVRAIVQLAHNLGMQVLAEGVETIAQLEELKKLGCEYWQGFHFSPAINAESAAALIVP